MGELPLAHCMASPLPPPGYNRQRPHCMVLRLPGGGTSFFQAGTEELVNEWVSTCNYWAARTSKEPLVGGVSNMEYGWNRVLDTLHRGRSASEDVNAKDSDAVSVRSARSSRSKFGSKAATVRSSPWADRVAMDDWKQPMASTIASTYDEETQLESLKKHHRHCERESEQHNELRGPMQSLVRLSGKEYLVYLLMPCLVSSALEQCDQGRAELDQEVQVARRRDRQVRRLHRRAPVRHVPPAQAARREGA